MAITNVLDGVLNASLTNQKLVQNLIAKSVFLSNIDGIVDGSLTNGQIVQNALLTVPTTTAYTGADITISNADDTAKPITVNQAGEFSAKILDIDTAQTDMTGLQDKFAMLGASSLQTYVDKYIATTIAAGAGTTGTAVLNITSANVDAYLEEGIELLLRTNVSESDIEVFVPSFVWTAALAAGGVVTETAQGAFSNGKVMNYMGAKIILSNNLEGTSPILAQETIFTTSWASQYVIGGIVAEATRQEANFASIVKGMALFGAGVLQPSAVIKTVVGK